MPWTTASTELRTFLSDGATDRLRYHKKCIGRTNGTNKTFQTLEFRRVTDLSTSSSPLGVFVNDVAVSVQSDNPQVGEFVLTAIPANGTEVRATYYYNWFLDSELDTFINQAVLWLGPGTDVTQVPPQLQPAVIHYAAGNAYQKLSVRWSETWGMIYKLEDVPTKDTVEQTLKGYSDMADTMKKQGETLRAQFYKRQDQQLQPAWVFLQGRVTDPVPKT